MKDSAHIQVKEKKNTKYIVNYFFFVESLMAIFELMINIVIYFCSYWFAKPFHISYITLLITS